MVGKRFDILRMVRSHGVGSTTLRDPNERGVRFTVLLHWKAGRNKRGVGTREAESR